MNSHEQQGHEFDVSPTNSSLIFHGRLWFHQVARLARRCRCTLRWSSLAPWAALVGYHWKKPWAEKGAVPKKHRTSTSNFNYFSTTIHTVYQACSGYIVTWIILIVLDRWWTQRDHKLTHYIASTVRMFRSAACYWEHAESRLCPLKGQSQKSINQNYIKLQSHQRSICLIGASWTTSHKRKMLLPETYTQIIYLNPRHLTPFKERCGVLICHPHPHPHHPPPHHHHHHDVPFSCLWLCLPFYHNIYTPVYVCVCVCSSQIIDNILLTFILSYVNPI